MSFIGMLQEQPLVAAFLFATLAVGLWAGKDVKTLKAYAVADRNLSTGVLTMTVIATFVSGWTVMRYPLSIYKMGIPAILHIGYLPVAALFIGLVIAPLMVHFPECYTLAAVMGKLYGKEVRILTGIISFSIGTLAIAVQVVALGELGKVLKVEQTEFIGFTALLFIGYAAFGGMRSVSYTDVLQFVVMIVGLTYVTSIVVNQAGGLSKVWAAAPVAKWSFEAHPISSTRLLYMLFSVTFPVALMYPGIMQRMLTARDKRQGRYMFWSEGAFLSMLLLVLIPLFVLGLSAIENNPLHQKIKSSDLLSFVLSLLSKGYGQPLFLIAILSMIMSTLDTYISSASLTLIYDVVLPLVNSEEKPKLSEQQTILLIKVATIVSGVSATGLAVIGYDFNQLHDSFQLFMRVLLIPFLLPLLGIKARNRDFLVAVGSNMAILVVAKIGWLTGKDTIRMTGTFFSLACFMLSHILTHGGIMTVKRTAQSVSEQLWLPERSERLARLRQWYEALCDLEATAYLHFRRYGGAPYVLGFFLAMQYMIPQLHFATGAKVMPATLLVLKTFGALFLAGLWLEGLWPTSKRHRFPLYYYLAIAYCLPFLTTLLSLYDEGTTYGVMQWLLMVLLLFAITDYILMFHLLPTGVILALTCYRCLEGQWLPTMSAEASYNVLYLALATPLILFAFGYLKEERMFAQVRVAKALGSGIAHETRNFLTGSMGMGSSVDQFLEMHPTKEVKPKEAKRPLYQVNQLVYGNMDALLENLREAGPQTEKKVTLFNDALRHERFDIHMDEHSIKACVAQALQDFFLSSEAAARRLETHLDDDFMAYCSAPFFGHLIYNLVRNAMHHGHAEKIRITTHAATRTLTIQDDGKGIPPARIPRIFDLFYTSDKGAYTSRTGLGLALVKEIIDSWKATIHVQSQQGKESYTRFEITFPPLKQLA